MFKDLINYFDFDKRNDNFTLVTSLSLDGSFIIHHLLSCGIRNKHKIYLINLAQTWSHYKSIQVKLGNGNALSQSIDNATFFNIDLINLVQNELISGINYSSLIKKAFDDLYSILSKSTNEKIMIIIDDFSVFNMIGFNENFIIEFIYNIKEFRNKVNLIVYLQLLRANSQLIEELKYLADSYFMIENLITGHSKEIQGQVKY